MPVPSKLSEVNVKNIFMSHIDKKIFLTFLFLTTYLYTFSLYENPDTFTSHIDKKNIFDIFVDTYE
jgi:hypothetical protein